MSEVGLRHRAADHGVEIVAWLAPREDEQAGPRA